MWKKTRIPFKRSSKIYIIDEESLQEEKPKYNKHKINTINKIHQENKEVIVYKICENLNEETAYLLERFFIKLIGRADKKLGILTNMTDGGEGFKGLSQEIINERVLVYIQTLKNNPSINIRRVISQREFYILNPEKKLIENKKHKNTLKNNPDIVKQFKKKEMETKRKDPSIMKKASDKGQKKKKENIEIEIQRVNNFKITWSNKSNKEIEEWKNSISVKHLETKSSSGKNNSSYVNFDFTFIILLYFNITTFVEMKKLYKIKHNDEIGRTAYNRFLNILNFPFNTTAYNRLNKTEIYLKFVEENKHRIQWYIDNYERLEDEYFEKIHYERNQIYYNKLALLK